MVHNVLSSRCDAGRRSSSLAETVAPYRLSRRLIVSAYRLSRVTGDFTNKHVGRAFLVNNTLQLRAFLT